MNVQGKVAIVTGASSGIGKATAQLLTLKGATVISASRHGPVIADMTNPHDIEKLVTGTLKKYGRIDILVNNAGRGYDTPVEYARASKVREIFDLDFMGPLRVMQAAIPIMRKQGGGAIVNVSSGTALITIPNNGPYSGIKSALALLSKTAGVELAKDHIAVSVVYPYMTDTNFEKNTMKTHVPPVTPDDLKDLPPMDPPDHVAKIILEAIQTGKPELYAHEWMKRQAS